MMNDIAYMDYKKYLGPLNLNLGPALNHELNRDGHVFINMDMNAEVKPQVVHNATVYPWPFPDSYFDAVMGSHFFEHVSKQDFLPMVAEIHRVLKSNGHLISFTPYGTSFDAWENPFHLQCFTETTFFYAFDDLYTDPKTAGYGASQGLPCRKWECETIAMVPWPEFSKDPDIEFKRRHYFNVIRELHVVLRAIK